VGLPPQFSTIEPDGPIATTDYFEGFLELDSSSAKLPTPDAYRQCRACTSRPRSLADIDVIVMHTPEGGVNGTLGVLEGTQAGFDFYLPLDGTLYQCNDYLRFVAWQAGEWSTNVRSVGIEQGDRASNSANFGVAHYERLANLVAGLVNVTNTPLKRARRIGEPGIIAHHDVTPKSRTDPGAGFRWDLLLELAGRVLGNPTSASGGQHGGHGGNIPGPETLEHVRWERGFFTANASTTAHGYWATDGRKLQAISAGAVYATDGYTERGESVKGSRVWRHIMRENGGGWVPGALGTYA